MESLDTLTSVSCGKNPNEPLLTRLRPFVSAPLFSFSSSCICSQANFTPDKTGIRRREGLVEGTSFALSFLLILLLLLPPAVERVDFGHLHK